ncbi:MAG: hypothetical protein E6I85_02110 [Chloroflexi bacterium]|nr:MAG: hypothetical protein E6I85_02110 [Chloroflexota bacterium]
MRIRHLVVAVIGLAVAAGVLRAALPDPGARPPVLEDGTINITASVDGLGAWAPYAITVRNLGDHNFSGRLLMVKRFQAKPGPAARLQPIAALPSIASPLGAASQETPPDAAYQFAVALSPRHKRTYSFFAPDDFVEVLVQDAGGLTVADVPVDNRKSVAVGVLTESSTLAAELQPIRIGELTVRVTQWDETHPFPDRASYLTGYSAVLIDRYDSTRLTRNQLQALSDFVGLGGQLLIAGAGDLARSQRGLPPQLVAFTPAGDTVLESLAPVAELSGLQTQLATQVAQGSLAKGARTVLDSVAGRPLEVEAGYGSGLVVELLFDPDTPTAGAGLAGVGLPTVAWTQALARGLQTIPGQGQPAGRTFLDPRQLPGVLFPKPSDSPFPALWFVGALLGLYLLLVVPLNYQLLRRIGKPALFWITAPVIALAFALVSYGIGQGLQAGIRDTEIQLYRVGPDGVLSRVAVHGIVFPTRGDHRLTFGADRLLAPYTIAYPDETPSCVRCALPASTESAGTEEHVLGGSSPSIAENGIVYGSVRIVGSAATGHGGLQLSAHLSEASDKVTGSILNTGQVEVADVFVYTYFQGGFRAAFVSSKLAPGQSVQLDDPVRQVAGAAPDLAPGTRLTEGQAISLIADETGRRTLSHAGQLAVVGFVPPAATGLAVDGTSPGGQVVAAFGLPVEPESAAGRLGEVAYPRLVGSVPDANAGALLDSYDIALPSTSGTLMLRYDQRLYSDVEVYDWQAHTWRSGQFQQDPTTPLVQLKPLPGDEIRNGLVRVRLHELAVSWGSDITVRFPGESP